jgi:hypothetical protein
MSTVATKTLQLGDSGTLANNFRITVPGVPDGTATFEKGDGTDLLKMAFSGSGLRLQSDFSIGTEAAKTLFQSSVVNGNTVIGAVPNGTGTVSAFRAISTADPTNGSFAGHTALSSHLNVLAPALICQCYFIQPAPRGCASIQVA